jgi:hypothetical protein
MARRLILFRVAKTFPNPVFDRTKYSSTELIVSFAIRVSDLFVIRAKDFFNYIDRFSLAFVIDPYNHLSQKTHSD